MDKRTATITWGTTTSFIYNGTERAPTATVSNKVGSDEVIVTVTGGQTNVNSYVATADTLTGTAALNYELPTTKPTQNFTITPKPVNVRLSGGCVLKVYDGTTNPGTSTVNIKTDDIIAGTGVNAYISKIPAYPSNIASNSHRLRVQVALTNNIYGNYELKTTTLDVQGIITAKPVTLNDGDLIITKEYDGTASAGTVDRFLSSADFETIDTNNNNVSVLITNVGDYADASVGTGKTVNLQVELTGSMKGNYRLANSSYSFTKAQIAQALPKVTVTAEKKATFSLFGIPIGNKEDTFIITATVDGVNGEKPAGTVQLKANGTALGAPLTLTNGVATYEWVQPNANTYTFTADFVGTGPNYATNSGTSEQYDISKAEQAPLTFTVASPVTYGDIPIAFNATGGTGTGAVTYSSSDTNVVLDDGTIKGVGTATITATKAADANYNAATATATITVNPAAPTLAWTADAAETLTYTGSEAVITKTPAVTLKNGETYSGTIKYAYKKAGLFSLFAVYTDGLPTDAGEYTIKAHIDAAGNYIAADSTNELTLTITKSTPTVSIKIDNYSGKTYDGTAIANPVVGDLNISGANYDDVTFVYSATVDMSNPSATAPTNAGTYYVQASIAASDNTNVAQSVAKEFTIAKKAVNATVTGNDKVYDGNNTANIALSVNTGIAADKISITATGATYDNKNVASNKTITTGGFITTGDKQDNYDITIPIITGKITQKTVSVTATVAAKDYDGSTNATATYTIEDKIATDTVTATATATFDNANVGIDKTVNITSIALAGKDNANYKLNSTTATAQGTINKANVTVTIEPIAVVDFTGTQIKPTVTVKTADGTALVTTDYTIAYGANVDAGTGLVTVKVAANGNYTFTDVTANFIINKITYTGTAITGTKLVVQNTAQKGVEFDLSTLTFPAGFKDKTFKSANIVTNTDNVLTGTPSITGTKLTFDVGSVVKDKSGEINVVVESKNYNDYTAKITVTTVDKTPITINGTAATGLVYNGSAQQGYTTVAVEGNKVPQDGLDFTYSGTDKSGATYGPTTTAPTKAGDYKLVVSVKSSNATYTGTSSDILFSIEQKPLTIKAKNQVTYQHKLDESGKPDIPVAELEYSGFVSSEDATALGANAYAAMHTAMVTTDAGKFTINVLGSTANTNYSITTASGNLTIQAVTVPKAPITTPPTSTVTEPEIVAKPDDPAKQLRVFSGELAQEDKTETLKQLTVPTGGVTITKEVELQVSADGGNTWKKATEADVKDRRVQVVFPIPDGTSPSTHTYVIYHFAKGATVAPVSLDTTVSEPTKSLSATVSSLSPFVAVATPKGGGNPGGGDSDDDSSTTYYYIKATAGPGGSMSTAERVKVRAGESAGFTITPDKGYQIADVLVNGKSIGAKNYYAFTKVYSDQTIHATFKKVGHQNPQTGVNFDDVTTDDWFYDAVMEATSNG
ncbi:MAG: YDG domain-containing protein [Oscillospiraceae bacterium]